MGNEQAVIRDQRIFDIANFKEKPDEKTAAEYFARWEYLWNAGYFIFLATSFREWINLYAPEIAPIFTVSEAELTETYTNLASTPIDTALVEKLPLD
jgi:mannose-1-phosphate guanylyltransferase